MRRLRDTGEHPWIARLVRRLGSGRDRRVLVGTGDDTAAVRAGRRPVLITTDALIEGTHFRAGWLTPRALGRRAFAVNASDVAAMGGVPTFAVLAIEAPARTAVATLDGIVAGFAAAARGAGARLVGGNLARGPHLAVTVALLGEAPGRVVTRTGARPGDLLYVTGTLGGAGLAVRRLAAGRRGRLPDPPLRVRAGVLLARVASAMIDVSDGIVQDAAHLCRPGLAAVLDLSQLPLAPGCRAELGRRAAGFAAAAGEDYELLVAVPPQKARALARLRPRLGCALTLVGRIGSRRDIVPVRRTRALRGGFDHFRARR